MPRPICATSKPVRQSGARRITFRRSQDLRLVGEPTQRGAVPNPGSVPGEVGTVLTLDTLLTLIENDQCCSSKVTTLAFVQVSAM